MDIIETSISINEKSNSSSDVNIVKNNNKIFPEEKPYNISLNIKKKIKKIKKFKIMNNNIFEGFFFWILSLLILIPGGYYSCQFYKAKRAKTETERKEILDRIPKLQRNIF